MGSAIKFKSGGEQAEFEKALKGLPLKAQEPNTFVLYDREYDALMVWDGNMALLAVPASKQQQLDVQYNPDSDELSVTSADSSFDAVDAAKYVTIRVEPFMTKLFKWFEPGVTVKAKNPAKATGSFLRKIALASNLYSEKIHTIRGKRRA